MPNIRLVHRSAAAEAFSPVKLKPGVMYVGRTADNDVALGSTNVSRRHAKIIFTDMGLTVHDLDSHNGVFLNGKKVRSTPVKLGDFLYFADVCCQLEATEGQETTDAFNVESSMNKSNLVSQVLRGEEANDPAVRNLSALIQATDLLLTTEDDDEFKTEMLSRCRDLTEAALAVLIVEDDKGEMTTPVVLREGTAPRTAPPVSWPVVNKAFAEGVVLFSKDTAADPLIAPEQAGAGEAGALMCVPIHVEGRPKAAIYLGRPFAGEGFTDREVETISALAHLIGVRMRGIARPVAAADGAGSTENTALHRGDLSTSEESEQVAKLEGRNEQLQSEVAELKTRAKSAGQGTAELQARISGMQGENQRLSGEITRLTNDLNQRQQGDGESQKKVVELEARLEAQLTEIAAARNDGASAREQISQLQREAQRATEEAQRAAGEFSKARSSADVAEEKLDAVERELAAAREKIAKQASGIKPENLVASTEALPPPIARRVVAIATGQTPTPELGAGSVTALCIGLAGFDSWSEAAGTNEAKARLDVFCLAVQEAVDKRDGVLEQMLGHAHLVTFPGDARGVQSAIDCAREVLEQVPGDNATGVQGGVHIANGGVGFFGPNKPVYAHFGEAIAIARGASEYARPGVIFVTAKVKDTLPEQARASLFIVGPHLIRGFQNPFEFFQVGPG